MILGETFAVRGNKGTTIRGDEGMEFKRVPIKFVDLGPEG